MSSEYYTLEKVAEVLGMPTAEVNRLRERSELRAFRDGASWKFRKAEVDDMLAEKIKSRSKQNNNTDDNLVGNGANGSGLGEDDFDLLVDDNVVELTAADEQNTSAFDAVMENGFEFDAELIDAPAARVEPATEPKSNLPKTNKPVTQPAAKTTTEPENVADESAIFSLKGEGDDVFALADDDLVLADDQPSNLSVAKKTEPVAASNTSSSKIAEKVTKAETAEKDDDLIFTVDELSLAEDDGLTLSDDSDSGNDILLDEPTIKTAKIDLVKENSKTAIDDELDSDLLKSFSDGSGLTGEVDEKLFELEDDNVAAKSAEDQVVFEQLNDDTDFLELINDDEQSELTEEQIVGGLTDEFKLTPDGFGTEDESESTSQFIPLDEKNTLTGQMFGEDGGSPFGVLPTTQPDDISAGRFSPMPQTSVSYQQEVQYSTLVVCGFIAAAVLLIFPCVMLLDLIANIWGWNESIPINSPIMNLITGITK
ncbi:MAG: helix-turn-helix domain-containing protein [Planctomycetaceae bacterium]|jgi:excisionase family DNA binding protein|nr:helix-turn-helix domain-containing protein [Planctomycetaceae bacterium]